MRATPRGISDIFVCGRYRPARDAGIAAHRNKTSGIALDPSGRFAYVANSDSNSISQFAIAADGRLAPLATPAVLAGIRPATMAVDATGQYVYETTLNNTVLRYAIDADGKFQAPAVTATGIFPAAIALR